METRKYWMLKEKALDRTLWKTGQGRSCGPVVKILPDNDDDDGDGSGDGGKGIKPIGMQAYYG